MNKNSIERRKFIKQVGLGTAAAMLGAVTSGVAMPKPVLQKDRKGSTAGKRILFQGDSITDGNRGRTEDPNHIMGHGYAFSIASRWGYAYPEKDLHFINRGVGSDKIIDLQARWQEDTLDQKPDILSILVGINGCTSMVGDWPPQVNAALFEHTYTQLLDQSLQALPNVQLVLCQPFILKVGQVAEKWEAYQKEMQQRQEIVAALALKYKAIFVPFQDALNKACKRAPADYWIWDGIHPRVAGHEVLALEWMKQVETLINE